MNNLKRSVTSVALSLVLALAPLSAFAQGKSHGKGNKGGKSHSQHWNPAPPKKNGRHDNRDWNKNRYNNDINWLQRRVNESDWAWRNRIGDTQYRNYTNRYGTTNYGYDSATRRNQTKNEWRNLAIGAGLIGVLGLLTKEPTLTFAGAAGALYSAYRYEQDRKSESRLARARYYYFSQPYFIRDGQRFERRTVTRNGQRYYQFVRD
jgi:hypothetical protein